VRYRSTRWGWREEHDRIPGAAGVPDADLGACLLSTAGVDMCWMRCRGDLHVILAALAGAKINIEMKLSLSHLSALPGDI
jgi:hypothetical protein